MLKSEEICAIIKVCGEAKVHVLKFEGLYLRFDTPVDPTTEAWTRARSQVAPAPDFQPQPATQERVDDLKKIEAYGMTQDELALRTEELAELWVTRPELAEQLLMDGELVTDGVQDTERET